MLNEDQTGALTIHSIQHSTFFKFNIQHSAFFMLFSLFTLHSSLFYSPLLHHQTAVLHDLDACLGEALGGGVVRDAELEPDALRPGGEDVLDMRRDVARTTEDVDHVDGTADIGQLAEHRTSEDLRHLGVVDGDG